VAAGFSVFLVRPEAGLWPSLLVQQHPGLGCQVKLDRSGGGVFAEARGPDLGAAPVQLGCCGGDATVPAHVLIPPAAAAAALVHFHATGTADPELHWE
jgi:hypothetical protein